MRNVITVCLIFLAGVPSLVAKVIVFSQDGFPTVASQPISREALIKALDGMNPGFLNIDGLKPQNALEGAELLILPYGSAFPVDAWHNIQAYLQHGGSLLILGGQPLRVAVTVL